jgi:hypothetical protein
VDLASKLLLTKKKEGATNIYMDSALSPVNEASEDKHLPVVPPTTT